MLAYAARQPIGAGAVASATGEAVEQRVRRGQTEVAVEPVAGEGWPSVWRARSVTASGEPARTRTVEIRSLDEPINFCDCPDFATNRLGTCKHVEAVLHRLRRRRRRRLVPERSVVHVDWQVDGAPDDAADGPADEAEATRRPAADSAGEDLTEAALAGVGPVGGDGADEAGTPAGTAHDGTPYAGGDASLAPQVEALQRSFAGRIQRLLLARGRLLVVLDAVRPGDRAAAGAAMAGAGEAVVLGPPRLRRAAAHDAGRHRRRRPPGIRPRSPPGRAPPPARSGRAHPGGPPRPRPPADRREPAPRRRALAGRLRR